MKKIALLILFMFSTALAAANRNVEADSMTSADHTKSYTIPQASGEIMLSVGIVQEIPSGTVNGSNTTFTLANTPVQSGTVSLYQDGVFLIQGGGNDYTISGATITMATAPALGQKLTAVYSKY